jgi:hypothetical protein
MSIPIQYGSGRMAGNIIYMSDIVETITRSKHRQDGVRYYEMVKTYTATFAIAFCEGPVLGLARIWMNNKVFADWRDPAGPYYPTGDIGLASANLSTTIARAAAYFSVYLGTETQTEDSALVALLTAAETPTYRGIFYIVFRDFPVGEFSGVPTIEVEIDVPMSTVSTVCDEQFEYPDGAISQSIFSTPGFSGAVPTISGNRLMLYAGGSPNVSDRYMLANFSFLGEFDYNIDFELVGTDYSFVTLAIAPGGSLDWQIWIEPYLASYGGVGRYEVDGDPVFDEVWMGASELTGKLRLRRDASDNIYAYYWNNSLSRWEWNSDTNGILLGTKSGSITPAFEMRTGDTSYLYVGDFITTSGCDNTQPVV